MSAKPPAFTHGAGLPFRAKNLLSLNSGVTSRILGRRFFDGFPYGNPLDETADRDWVVVPWISSDMADPDISVSGGQHPFIHSP
jgi:hypothetical protein